MFFHSLFAIYCTQGLLREIKAEFWPSGNTVKRYQRFDVVLGIYYRKKCGQFCRFHISLSKAVFGRKLKHNVLNLWMAEFY